MTRDNEIDCLVIEIQYIKITTAQSIQRLEGKIQDLRRRSTRQPKGSVSRNQGEGASTGTVIINSSNKAVNTIVHQVKLGSEIHFGTKVIFLSKGKYDSTEDILVSTDSVWVRSRDFKGRLIKRAPRNLQVLAFMA